MDATSDRLDLGSILYWELPQLNAAEAASLAEAVYPEVELRVGQCISARCTDAELEEFGALIDAGDDRTCARWLDEHVPDHPAITAAEVEALVAEAVATVERGDAATCHEPVPKRTRRIEGITLTLLERVLDFQRREYFRDGDVLVTVHERGAAQSVQSVLFRLHLVGSRLCLQSTFPQPFPKDRNPDLLTFVHRWNATQYLPKGYVAAGVDEGDHNVVAQMVVPVAPGIHGQLLDHVIETGIGATCRMFDALAQAASEWQPTLL